MGNVVLHQLFSVRPGKISPERRLYWSRWMMVPKLFQSPFPPSLSVCVYAPAPHPPHSVALLLSLSLSEPRKKFDFDRAGIGIDLEDFLLHFSRIGIPDSNFSSD